MDELAGARAVSSISGAQKTFGAVRALDGADFSVSEGECVGLVGHNGAGKSTLVNVINGGLGLDEGTVVLSGGNRADAYSIKLARRAGIRCVFQELSLCPNLSVLENLRVAHPGLTGPRWRTKARALILDQLETIFPGHGIRGTDVVGDLTIAQRQMVEIAAAFSRHDARVSLVILDEPTSSLDASRARQLIEYVKTFTGSGGSVIFISHILGEILEAADRVVVMRDGKVVSDKQADAFSVPSLVQAMGSVAAEREARRPATLREEGEKPLVRFARDRDESPFVAYRGEVVALAGLSGHGQTQLLVDLYMSLTSDWRATREPNAVFVAGDRLVDGVFPVWSILHNMSLSVLPQWVRRGLVDAGRELGFGEQWRDRIGIRTNDLSNPILSLSGGNQQKVLFARALGARCDLVLMDDPMRGVDIGTKQDVYGMVRAEADKSRTFVWYSTEMEEIALSDRVYVFREGRIVRELVGDKITEDNVLAASFGERAA